MADFVERHGLGDIVHLVDDDGTLWERFGIVTQPSWVFVDDGGAAASEVGALGRDGLEARMDELVAR